MEQKATKDAEQQAIYTEMINSVIEATRIAKAAGFTGKQVWTHVKSAVMELAGVSESVAAAIVRQAWEQAATTDTEDRKALLEEAQELISSALALIREATQGDDYVEAYLCAPLSVIIDEGRYLSRDLTIGKVIEGMEEDNTCTGCGSALDTTPPCPACGERMCQDCEDRHVCGPE